MLKSSSAVTSSDLWVLVTYYYLLIIQQFKKYLSYQTSINDKWITQLSVTCNIGELGRLN